MRLLKKKMLRVVMMMMPCYPDGDAEDLGLWDGCACRFVGRVVVLSLTNCSCRLLAILMGLSNLSRLGLRMA